MTTQNLNPATLPYAGTAAVITAVYNALVGAVVGLKNLSNSVGTALKMRNRYAELNALSDEHLTRIGLSRNDIPQVVAAEAGLFTPDEVAPVAHNTNAPTVRTAA